MFTYITILEHEWTVFWLLKIVILVKIISFDMID